MNFNDAMRLMADGHKVRLSEWLGYWHMPKAPFDRSLTLQEMKNEVVVFTRDGSHSNVPFFDRYEGRDDWQIADGSMGFDFAIRALKARHRVFRYGWNGKGMYLRLIAASGYTVQCSPSEAEYCNQDPYIMMKSADDTLVPWIASQTDMLASDWWVLD